MSTHCCQHDEATTPRGATAAARVAGWALRGVSGLLLVLMPKCPMCVAAYVAAWTGIGLSMPAAAGVRTGLMIVCIASLAALAAMRVKRTLGRRSARARTDGQPMQSTEVSS